MRAGKRNLAESIEKSKRRIDPYVLIFWASVMCMILALVLGIVMVFI